MSATTDDVAGDGPDPMLAVLERIAECLERIEVAQKAALPTEVSKALARELMRADRQRGRLGWPR